MLKDILNYIPQIHKEGYVFIAIAILFTLIALSFSKSIGVIFLIITIWCVTFFRDPERVTPHDAHLIVSPADGRVDKISKVTPPKEFHMGDDKVTRVSVFLSVFDVHVNRIPISGTVKTLNYHPGKFLSATLDKSSDLNERQSVLIETKDGTNIAVVQIAGLIARRIVCDLDENQEVKTGERFGIIRFGSRVDLYIPKKLAVQVLEGQYMIGGETVIAKLS
jgi:phosphatidylserine decarboxylase